MKRKQLLKGKVKSIVTGMGSSEIITELPEATEITSIITKTSAENLNLKIGNEIYAAFKASSVMIATD
nr:TOBE domain-containing protein [Methanosarcina sp. UBA411]